MNVLVDTSVWSSALRKRTLAKAELSNVAELKELIHEARVVMIGPVRQELLSGISDDRKFSLVKERLQAFEDLSISQSDYEKAAEFFNACRRKGIQGSHIDFLICAVAFNNKLSIFTTDKDFQNYASILEIVLHHIRGKADIPGETR